jgi:hypothetical protein
MDSKSKFFFERAMVGFNNVKAVPEREKQK